MPDGISSDYSYRNQWTNQLTGTNSTSESGQVWNAVFTDEKTNGVTIDDFLSLMVAQLQNQDFMNPVDDTQYITQLAQFSSMQAMQELATYTKTNYVMSLVGKTVTAANLSISGELKKETGVVEKVSLVNNEFTIYVNGKSFSMQEIMEVGTTSSLPSEQPESGADTEKLDYLRSLVGEMVSIRLWDENGDPDGKVIGRVDKISTENDTYQVYVEYEWYPLEDVYEVGEARIDASIEAELAAEEEAENQIIKEESTDEQVDLNDPLNQQDPIWF